MEPVVIAAAASTPPPVGNSRNRRLLVDIATLMWRLRLPLSGLFFALGISAALQPSFAWISKALLEDIEQGGFDLLKLILAHGPIFLAICLGLEVAKFGEKIINKVVETRLIIELQLTYMQRRRKTCPSTDVSQILYGSEVAKKGFEAVYKEAWKITAQTVSVLIWQISLGAQWIPLMILSVLPSITFVWFFGTFIQRTSNDMLNHQSGIAASTNANRIIHLRFHQERFFRSVLKFEFFKWCAEEAMDIVMWGTLALLVLAAWYFDLGLLPEDIAMGGLAAFLVNLKLLAKPLGDIGKVYTKWREAYPALERGFFPGEQEEHDGK
jgi:hypothetical protein